MNGAYGVGPLAAEQLWNYLTYGAWTFIAIVAVVSILRLFRPR